MKILKHILSILFIPVIIIAPFVVIILLSYWLFCWMSPNVTFFKFSVIIIFTLLIVFIWNKFFKSRRKEQTQVETIIADLYINKGISNNLLSFFELKLEEIQSISSKNKNRFKNISIEKISDEIEIEFEKYYSFCNISEDFEYTLGDLFYYLDEYNYLYINDGDDIEIKPTFYNELTNDWIISGNLSITLEIMIQLIDYLSTKSGHWKSNTIEIMVSKSFNILSIEILRDKMKTGMRIRNSNEDNVDWKLNNAKRLVKHCNYRLQSTNNKNFESYSLLFAC